MNSPPATVQFRPAPDKEETWDFVTRAVHDLREPLRAIRASSELLVATRGEASGEVENRCLGLIQGGVDKLEILIRDIADYWYGEVRELDPILTNLENVLREAQRQLVKPLRESEAVLTHDAMPMVRADFFALAAVFHNLIQNSCKFRADRPLHIHIGVSKDESEWRISVEDNGRGFDPAYKDRIFKPFERLNGKQFPGSGLGLARAKRIVEQHGGRIWADGKPGEGCTVSFTLPVEGQAPSGSPGAREPELRAS